MKSFDQWVNDLSGKIEDKSCAGSLNYEDVELTDEWLEMLEPPDYSLLERPLLSGDWKDFNFWQNRVLFCNGTFSYRECFGKYMSTEQLTNLHCWKYLEFAKWSGCDHRPNEEEIFAEYDRIYSGNGPSHCDAGSPSVDHYIEYCKKHDIYS